MIYRRWSGSYKVTRSTLIAPAVLGLLQHYCRLVCIIHLQVRVMYSHVGRRAEISLMSKQACLRLVADDGIIGTIKCGIEAPSRHPVELVRVRLYFRWASVEAVEIWIYIHSRYAGYGYYLIRN